MANAQAPKFTATSGPTTLTYYATGLCSSYTISSSGTPCGAGASCYNQWYLPAICEMITSAGAGCTASISSITTNLPFILGTSAGGATSCPNGTNCLYNSYWTSTMYSTSPNNRAWYTLFSSPNGSSNITKNYPLGVRCIRAVTI